MNVVVADSTGLIKRVNLKEGKQTAVFGSQALENGVVHMCWSGAVDGPENEITVALASGIVQSRSVESGDVVRQFKRSRGITGLGVTSVHGQRTLLTCSLEGELSTSTFDDPDTVLKTMKVGTDVRAMSMDPLSQTRFAVGGKEQLLTIWDLEAEKPVFRARNVPHTKIELRVPVWVSALDHFPSDSNMIVSGTAYHQVRLFDIRVNKRRAIADVKIGENAITCVRVSSDSRYVFVGDGGGELTKLDLRASLRHSGRFRGVSGSIRSISCHPTEPLISVAGLDRFLRVFDINTRFLHSKVYLKQKLNAVLFSAANAAPEPVDESESEVEALWKEIGEAEDEVEDLDENGSVIKKRKLDDGSAVLTSGNQDDSNDDDGESVNGESDEESSGDSDDSESDD